MRYCSFATRDYLILENLPLGKDLSLLEIGVGLGSIVGKMIGKVKEYYGVDIACEVINYLTLLYKDISFVHFSCLDVCKDSSSLNKKFNVIFSTHTLEHVSSPQGYFNFIKRHLKSNGFAFVVFPNETKDRHHGITWFDNKNELMEIIDKVNLEVAKLLEVKETIWHRTIKKLLWEIPKSIILRNKKNPQTFEETDAFKIIKSHNLKTNIIAFYAKIVTELVAIFPLHGYKEIGENIQNKTLFIHLTHK